MFLLFVLTFLPQEYENSHTIHGATMIKIQRETPAICFFDVLGLMLKESNIDAEGSIISHLRVEFLG